MDLQRSAYLVESATIELYYSFYYPPTLPNHIPTRNTHLLNMFYIIYIYMLHVDSFLGKPFNKLPESSFKTSIRLFRASSTMQPNSTSSTGQVLRSNPGHGGFLFYTHSNLVNLKSILQTHSLRCHHSMEPSQKEIQFPFIGR